MGLASGNGNRGEPSVPQPLPSPVALTSSLAMNSFIPFFFDAKAISLRRPSDFASLAAKRPLQRRNIQLVHLQ